MCSASGVGSGRGSRVRRRRFGAPSRFVSAQVLRQALETRLPARKAARRAFVRERSSGRACRDSGARARFMRATSTKDKARGRSPRNPTNSSRTSMSSDSDGPPAAQTPSFAELGLPEVLTRATDALGFTHCTEIQGLNAYAAHHRRSRRRAPADRHRQDRRVPPRQLRATHRRRPARSPRRPARACSSSPPPGSWRCRSRRTPTRSGRTRAQVRRRLRRHRLREAARRARRRRRRPDRHCRGA